MKWQVDENEKLMKWQVDEMVIWWNGKLIKSLVDEMATYMNTKLFKQLVDKMASRIDAKLMKQPSTTEWSSLFHKSLNLLKFYFLSSFHQPQFVLRWILKKVWKVKNVCIFWIHKCLSIHSIHRYIMYLFSIKMYTFILNHFMINLHSFLSSYSSYDHQNHCIQ
jgi:hypothetical protein